MSFRIGLTGLNAAQQDLEIVSNNIANSNTIGFKGSRAEFSDVYASSIGSGNGQVAGVEVASISQQFSQGSITSTDNALDMAVNGQGFFVVNDNGQMNYTRAGFFQLDANNNVVNNKGLRLQGYSADASGNVLAGTQTDLKINQTSIPAQATTDVVTLANLDARTDAITPAVAIDPTNRSTFNSTMAFNVNDSLGGSHTVSMYFAKTADNAWNIEYYFDGQGPDLTQPVTFNNDGTLATPVGGAVTLGIPAGDARLSGADAMSFNIDFSDFTQLGTDSSVNYEETRCYPPYG